MVDQLSIFDLMYDKYKITKPIRLIELFSGYGSQALALKYLGVDFIHWHICEWATKSIQAYNDLHIRDYTDYSKGLTTDAIVERLAAYGISMDYNKPMTLAQIKRKGEAWQRKTYNNIIATHNLVDISKVKAKDLNIIDTDKYEYILTYSFPCQDLSKEGKKQGMSKASNTRSGLLWQVERILNECENLPQVLIMENVPQVLNADFILWQQYLEKLGYKNNYKLLKAVNYSIPQARERVFMISILGGYFSTFPKKQKMKLNVKDILELKIDFNKYQVKENIMQQLIVLNTPNEIGLRNGTKKGYQLIKKYQCFNTAFPKSNSRRGRVTGNIAPTLMTLKLIAIYTDQGFRYLTAKEYFKLMGVKPNDFNKISVNQTENSLYHLAGDSIVTTILIAIFGELLGLDYETKIAEVVEELKECS